MLSPPKGKWVKPMCKKSLLSLNTDITKYNNNDFCKKKIKSIKKKIISCKIQKIRKNSHNKWEYSYFVQLIDMYKIFINGLNKIYNIQEDDFNINSIYFLKFTKFIFEQSSGNITPYLNDITEETFERYTYEIIKRNNILLKEI